ncbi:hypothetical protein D3C78_1828860 [compost metagenome]
MEGIGWVQTSSPTASVTGWPCSFQASTAAPSWRHCITPGTRGSSRLPPRKAPQKSVPPEILFHQMSSSDGSPGRPSASARARSC